jgi:WD40 repeat protein
MTLGPPHRLCALSGQPAAGRAKRYSIARRCMHTAISPDGRWLAADGCRSAAAGVWDAQPGERVFDRPGCHARGMVFSPDGRFLVCSDADGLSLWEPGSWRLLRRAEGQVGTLRFTRDGRYLAGSLASQTSVVRLFDANTLEPLASLEPPETYPTYDLAFSSDDAWLAQIISRDGLVHLWDLRRIRATLAGMGLDWGLPPYPDAPVNPEPPSRIEIHSAAPAVQ